MSCLNVLIHYFNFVVFYYNDNKHAYVTSAYLIVSIEDD